eukprot:g2088.t1
MKGLLELLFIASLILHSSALSTPVPVDFLLASLKSISILEYNGQGSTSTSSNPTVHFSKSSKSSTYLLGQVYGSRDITVDDKNDVHWDSCEIVEKRTNKSILTGHFLRRDGSGHYSRIIVPKKNDTFFTSTTTTLHPILQTALEDAFQTIESRNTLTFIIPYSKSLGKLQENFHLTLQQQQRETSSHRMDINSLYRLDMIRTQRFISENEKAQSKYKQPEQRKSRNSKRMIGDQNVMTVTTTRIPVQSLEQCCTTDNMMTYHYATLPSWHHDSSSSHNTSDVNFSSFNSTPTEFLEQSVGSSSQGIGSLLALIASPILNNFLPETILFLSTSLTNFLQTVLSGRLIFMLLGLRMPGMISIPGFEAQDQLRHLQRMADLARLDLQREAAHSHYNVLKTKRRQRGLLDTMNDFTKSQDRRRTNDKTYPDETGDNTRTRTKGSRGRRSIFDYSSPGDHRQNTSFDSRVRGRDQSITHHQKMLSPKSTPEEEYEYILRASNCIELTLNRTLKKVRNLYSAFDYSHSLTINIPTTNSTKSSDNPQQSSSRGGAGNTIGNRKTSRSQSPTAIFEDMFPDHRYDLRFYATILKYLNGTSLCLNELNSVYESKREETLKNLQLLRLREQNRLQHDLHQNTKKEREERKLDRDHQRKRCLELESWTFIDKKELLLADSLYDMDKTSGEKALEYVLHGLNTLTSLQNVLNRVIYAMNIASKGYKIQGTLENMVKTALAKFNISRTSNTDFGSNNRTTKLEEKIDNLEELKRIGGGEGGASTVDGKAPFIVVPEYVLNKSLSLGNKLNYTKKLTEILIVDRQMVKFVTTHDNNHHKNDVDNNNDQNQARTILEAARDAVRKSYHNKQTNILLETFSKVIEGTQETELSRESQLSSLQLRLSMETRAEAHLSAMASAKARHSAEAALQISGDSELLHERLKRAHEGIDAAMKLKQGTADWEYADLREDLENCLKGLQKLYHASRKAHRVNNHLANEHYDLMTSLVDAAEIYQDQRNQGQHRTDLGSIKKTRKKMDNQHTFREKKNRFTHLEEMARGKEIIYWDLQDEDTTPPIFTLKSAGTRLSLNDTTTSKLTNLLEVWDQSKISTTMGQGEKLSALATTIGNAAIRVCSTKGSLQHQAATRRIKERSIKASRLSSSDTSTSKSYQKEWTRLLRFTEQSQGQSQGQSQRQSTRTKTGYREEQPILTPHHRGWGSLHENIFQSLAQPLRDILGRYITNYVVQHGTFELGAALGGRMIGGSGLLGGQDGGLSIDFVEKLSKSLNDAIGHVLPNVIGRSLEEDVRALEGGGVTGLKQTMESMTFPTTSLVKESRENIVDVLGRGVLVKGISLAVSKVLAKVLLTRESVEKIENKQKESKPEIVDGSFVE